MTPPNHRLPFAMAVTIIILAAPPTVLSQTGSGTSSTDTTVRIVPGPEYKKLGGQSWLFGSGYRDLWTDTISAPVLDLDTVGGGLSPVCSPATLLTSDLRFSAADGSGRLFRSMDKPFAERYLPRSLQHTLAGDMIQDFVSGDHPAAPLVVPPLYRAAGIPYPQPTLVALPDSQFLGIFGGELGGTAGFLSAELTPGTEAVPGLASTVEIITTEELWERTKGADDSVDQRSYLTSRLLDLLVGDAGVNYNRLRWGRPAGGVPHSWSPIPWDRDQALATNTGLLKWYGRFYLPQIVKFGESYPSIFGLTWAASVLDRRYLSSLSAATWDSVVNSVQAQITDSLINHSVRLMPPEMFQQNGAELIHFLMTRRDSLGIAARVYYSMLAEWTDVHSTGDGGLVEVTRLPEGRLRLDLWHADSSGTKTEPPYLSRVFDRKETREIRLYLDGTNDSVVVQGSELQPIKLIVVASSDADMKYLDSFSNTQVQHPVNEPELAKEAASFIQLRSGSYIVLDRTPRALSHACPAPTAQTPPALRTRFRDWGSAWVPIPALGYVSGLGVYAGLGLARTNYGFQAIPFKAQHVVWGGYASTPKSFFAEYYSDVRNMAGPVGGYLSASVSGVDNPEFYGFGNDTPNDQPASFYQIKQNEALIRPLATLNPGLFTQVAVGFYYTNSRTQTGTGNIIDSLQPFGAGTVDEVGLAAFLHYDTYNDEIATPSGFRLNITGQVGRVGGDSTYASLGADLLGFTSSDHLPGHPTLGVRLGAKKSFGNFPYYGAAYIGGDDNLKGYAPNRFAGDASVYLNTELRIFLAELRWPISGNFGILGLADVARVFVSGESSDVWHTGFGGGIWLGLLRSGEGLSIAVVEGESLRLYISTGFILKIKRIL